MYILALEILVALQVFVMAYVFNNYYFIKRPKNKKFFRLNNMEEDEFD